MPSSPLLASIVGRKHSPWSRKSPKNSAKASAGTLPDTASSFIIVTNIHSRRSTIVFTCLTLTSFFRLLTVGSGLSFRSATFVTENPLTLFWEPHADRIDRPAQTQDAPGLSRRHFAPAMASRSASPRHGIAGLHRLPVRVVAFRLPGLAGISDLECAL